MVYKRRYAARGRRRYTRPTKYRRTTRGRRFQRRRRFTRRRPRWYSKKYNFKEKFVYTQIHIANTGPVNAGFTVKAVDLPGWGNRHVNFDQYKIYKWKIVVMPPSTQGNLTDTTTTGFVGMEAMRHYMGFDFTDATAPTTVSSMLGPSCINTVWTHPLKMIIRPKISKMAYQSVSSTGYMPGTAWIDVDDDQVPHYGIKWMLDNSTWGLQGNQPQLNYIVNYTVYYGFKNVNRPGNT